MCPRIYDIACKIYHHLNIRNKEDFNCCLDLVVYAHSIGITIEDECATPIPLPLLNFLFCYYWLLHNRIHKMMKVFLF